MNIVRPLLHLLLSLALVAGAVVPDLARSMAVHGASAAPAVAEVPPPCHDPASDPTESAPADVAPGCCDEGACSCDCLRHAPVAMVPVPRLLSRPTGPLTSALTDRPSPDPAPLPSLRPPIA